MIVSMGRGTSSIIRSDLDQAVEVFSRGFAFGRSFAYPAEARLVQGIWVIRDQKRERAKDYRLEEWTAVNLAPAKVDSVARKNTRGRFCICAVRSMDTSKDALRDGYRALGYRLGTTEAFMIHRLKSIAKCPQVFSTQRVMSQKLADAVAKAARSRQILTEDLRTDAPMRLYAAMDGKNPIGWARGVVVGNATWVSSVFVLPAYRRRGIGKSMMGKMLRDDRALGIQRSILLASRAGQMLYNSMGYETIGELLIYTTPRKKT